MRSQRIGCYNVTSLLGEGGMGQVWQATVTQLGREVGPKILPDASPVRSRRFALWIPSHEYAGLLRPSRQDVRPLSRRAIVLPLAVSVARH